MKSSHALAALAAALILVAADACRAQAAEEEVPATQTADAFIEALKPEPAPAPAPRTRGMAAAPVAAAPPAPKSADLEVYFGFNSDRILGASVRRADNLAVALKDPKLADGRFTVIGHTDAVGTKEANQHLSQLRANAVRDYLIARGVPAERLRAEGRGFDELKNKAEPEADENRRVEIVAEY